MASDGQLHFIAIMLGAGDVFDGPVPGCVPEVKWEGERTDKAGD
jgi:hypothetical protein